MIIFRVAQLNLRGQNIYLGCDVGDILPYIYSENGHKWKNILKL